MPLMDNNGSDHSQLQELEKIMKKIYPPISWICIIVLWSCSTVRVSQNYQLETDFSNLKTYRWQPIARDIQGDEPMDDPLRDEHIQITVDRNLHALGFREATVAKPDFFIDFQYSVYRVTEPSGVSGQAGIGRWGGANETFGGIGVGTGRGRYTRQEGVLHIEVIDPKNGHILWRGTGTHQVEQHWNPETKTEKTDELVGKVLAQIPPVSNH
jgi:hypothetical protein